MALGTKRKAANTLSKQPLDLPPATVHAFAGTASPEGWAMCDGSEVSRTDYAALFAAIGTTYGVGDGSTTFNLPDMRGEFLRGLDNMGTAAGAAGKDVDGTARTVGQTQAQASRYWSSQVDFKKNAGTNLLFPINGGASRVTGSSITGNAAYSSATYTADRLTLTNSTLPTSTNEVRPVNMAVNYIIKL